MLASLTPRGPGEGPHWERLALWLKDQIPTADVDGVWVFRVLRRDLAEYGTAVISRIDGDRRRIYTARYTALIKGKKRGGFDAVMDEVGSGPLEFGALHLAGDGTLPDQLVQRELVVIERLAHLRGVPRQFRRADGLVGFCLLYTSPSPRDS